MPGSVNRGYSDIRRKIYLTGNDYGPHFAVGAVVLLAHGHLL